MQHSACTFLWDFSSVFQKVTVDIFYVISFLIAGPRCMSKDFFACKKSMQCIPNEFVCDGRVQCGEGSEDENFDLCKSRKAFAKRAKIECIEEYRPNNQPTTILATNCDAHIECQNNKDESPGCLPDSGKLQINNFITPQECLGFLHILLRQSFWLSWPLPLSLY